MSFEKVRTKVRLFELLREPLARPVRRERRVRFDLRPVERDEAELHQTRLRAQPQYLHEEAVQFRQVVAAEARDRRAKRASRSR